MPTDVYLFPCSFLFTMGVLSIVWPDVLKEFAWMQHRKRSIRSMAWVLIVTGAFCWAARHYCRIDSIAAPVSVGIFFLGVLLLCVPSIALRGLRGLVLARPGRIRILGLTFLLFSTILLIAACPRPPYSLSGAHFA